MKRTIIVTLFCVSVTLSIHAQLLVDRNGKVGIKVSSESVNSYVSVNSTGDSDVCTYIRSNSDSIDVALKVIKTGEPNTGHSYSHGVLSSSKCDASSIKMAFGLCGQAHKSNGMDSGNGRSYGVFGLGGNASAGWNYGVLGTLYGNNNGAGVFGSSSNYDMGMNTEGKYAGFFHGDVKSTDAMFATVFNTISDYRLKENIEPIASESINKLMKLNVVRYNLVQRSLDDGDTTTVPINYYTGDTDFLKKTHYGLIAQELQDIYPELVYEGGDGYLSVNYIELIPLLIQSVQSLKEEVEQLKATPQKTNRATMQSPTSLENKLSSINKISVSDENVTLTCNISSSVKNAYIIITDTNGIQVYSNYIKERGRVELEIKDLYQNDDIILCSLITDEDIDSRRFYFGR